MTRKSSAADSFEAAVSELEAIVREMEAGELALERALERYQRGVALLRYCQRTLGEAEARVRILEGDSLQPLDVGDSPPA